MSSFVVDCSVTLGWCFANQADAYTRKVLDALDVNEAWTPSLWPLETANALAVGERRKKITRADAAEFLDLLAGLPINIEEDTSRRAFGLILHLAREQDLSAYDAAYLELALRERLPLATRDDALKRAARALGVPLVSP